MFQAMLNNGDLLKDNSMTHRNFTVPELESLKV